MTETNQRDSLTEADDRTPLYNSRILSVYLQYLQKTHPEVDIDAILNHAGITKQEIEDQGHWFNQRHVDGFHEKLVEETGDPTVAREAGRFASSSEGLGASKQYLLGLLKLSSSYMLLGKLYPLMSRGADVSVRKMGINEVEVTVTPAPGVREKPYQCENRIGFFESVPKFFSREFGHVEHPFCYHKGDGRCLYNITWKTEASQTWRRIKNISLPTVALLSLALFFFLPTKPWLISNLFLFASVMSLLFHTQRVENREYVQAIEFQGDTARENIDEMNIRYNNAMLAREIGEATSAILDTDELVKAITDVLQRRLDFSRGVVMLIDDESGGLSYAAGYGYTEEQENYLKNAELGATGTESGDLFHSLLNEHKPILVNNFSNVEGRLSKENLEIATRMGTRSMICTPLVYENQSLGILAVDNVEPKRLLTQSDMGHLMGIAMQMAVSIVNTRSYRQIRESEEKYRLLADNASDVISIIDLEDYCFSYVSPSVEKLRGYTAEEAIAMSLEETVTMESMNNAFNILTEVMEKETRGELDTADSRTMELEHFHKDGSTIWAEITMSFIRDDDGKPIKILGITRDTTERRRAEEERKKLQEQLQRAHKMEAIGTLAGGVAHDLNNILSGLIGYPELLLLDLPEDSPLREPLETILKSGEKASAIVQDLLTLARRGVAVMDVSNLNAIIEEHLQSPEFHKVKSFHPNVRFETRLEPLLFNIKGSPHHLSKTIMNLLSNAAEAMPDGGEVLISTENRYLDGRRSGFDPIPEGEYVICRIRDAGVGISHEDIEKIFDPFYTKKQMGRSGTGLGMAVVWGTVKDHDGYIDIQSVVDEGTTITIYLPVTREKAEAGAVESSPEAIMGGGESILVIDDVPEQREIASVMLTRLGYSVTTASSGEEAVETLQANRADLLILDMIMDPGMDGLETYRKISGLQPGQKAIIASGFSETSRVKETLQLGAGAYVRKPYTLEQIGLAVKKELKR